MSNWLVSNHLPVRMSLIRLLLPFLVLLASDAQADTLSPCGWRGTRTLRCYEETNGVLNFQPDEERYWSGGVEELERVTGRTFVSPYDKGDLVEPCYAVSC